jgi:uncharacterized protein (UPF0276 family)
LNVSAFKTLGFGLGLRPKHCADIVAGKSRSDWFEALTENYLGLPGLGSGQPLSNLLEIRQLKPVVLHGVSLSIGGTDPLNPLYLNRLSTLIERVEPEWVSDHLCWTGVHGFNAHDLLPLPYTRETVNHVVSRIQTVQDRLRRPLVIENVSSYVEFQESEMTEAQFLREVVIRSGCGLLLDINNIYVSARNHGFNPRVYLEHIPWKQVAQFHLAGHTDKGHIVIDTHDEPVRDEVWDLYAHAIRLAPNVSVMIERDDNIPELSVLELELSRAEQIHNEQTQRNPNTLL